MSVPRYATPPVVPPVERVVCVVCGDPAGHPEDGRCFKCLDAYLLQIETERRNADQPAWEASLPERYDTAAEMAREMGEGDA